MILKFLKQLFCFPHHYEQELSPFDDEWLDECRSCEKTRKVKKVIIQESVLQLLYINADFDEHGLAKFYIPVDDDTFKLSGTTISRNKEKMNED